MLGDTSYSECCIDDVNASHAKSNDLIIKFGHSCFSTSSVSKQHTDKQFLYVLPDNQIDMENLREQLNQITGNVVLYANCKFYSFIQNQKFNHEI